MSNGGYFCLVSTVKVYIIPLSSLSMISFQRCGYRYRPFLLLVPLLSDLLHLQNISKLQ
jgi:hypothetical protein